MVPAQDLLLDDAPWLRDRIDLGSVNLLHGDLRMYGRELGVGRLSACVREELVDAVPAAPDSLPPRVAEALDKWTRTCRWPEFRGALWRLLCTRGLAVEDATAHKFRVYELAEMAVCAAARITSRFLVEDRDVTLQPHGSAVIIGQEAGMCRPCCVCDRRLVCHRTKAFEKPSHPSPLCVAFQPLTLAFQSLPFTFPLTPIAFQQLYRLVGIRRTSALPRVGAPKQISYHGAS